MFKTATDKYMQSSTDSPVAQTPSKKGSKLQNFQKI